MTKYKVGDKLTYPSGTELVLRIVYRTTKGPFYSFINDLKQVISLCEQDVDDAIINLGVIYTSSIPPKYNIGDQIVSSFETPHVISLPDPVYYSVRITTHNAQTYSAAYQEETLNDLLTVPGYQYAPAPTQHVLAGPSSSTVYVLDELNSLNTHKGHEVVQSSALGKEFNYCRKCKEEVE